MNSAANAAATRSRILVVCPTDWERTAVATPALQAQYEFFFCCEELYDAIGLWRALHFNVQRYLDRLIAEYRPRGISGILGTGDYPGCMFGAYLANGLGLPAPRARDTVLLSHKYYSRQVQRQLVPEATPDFEILDPLIVREPRRLRYPFFIKPVKGTMSIRAQLVHDRAELGHALRFSAPEALRAWILLRPFAQLLASYQDRAIPARCFIAEAPLRGVQVTVDGFVQNGRVTIMGIVDSIMYPGTSSFQRFEYPSALPAAVQQRMNDVTTRLMGGSGFDHSCFNVELFYDKTRDLVSIIEINPRMSYQFSDLFQRVDGLSSFSVQLALATGQPVHWLAGCGPEKFAASFVLRRFSDARVVAVPNSAQLDEVAQRFPGTQVKVLCSAGERLSEHDQDVGSYRYCIINMAAPEREILHARFAAAEQILQFRFE